MLLLPYDKRGKVEGVEVAVYSIDNNGIHLTERKRTLYGISTFHDNSKIIEYTTLEPRSWDELERSLRRVVKAVQSIDSRLKLCPTHSGWMKRLSGKKIRCDLLFSYTGIENSVRNSTFSRRNSLDFHLQSRSTDLGNLSTVAIVRGNSPISAHDGCFYVRKSSLKTDVESPVKLIGYADYSRQHMQAPSEVIKGMAVILDDPEWQSLCLSCGVQHVDVIVPEITLKFDSGKDVLNNVRFFKVFDSVRSDFATLSIQAAERMPLTEYGQSWIKEQFSLRVNEVVSAYGDSTGQSVYGLLDQEFKQMIESSDVESEIVDDEQDYFIDKAEILSATHIALATGLPMTNSEYLNATLPTLLRTRVKSIRMEGLTIVALPDDHLNSHEIRMPKADMRRISLRIGDMVTISRYPNTGIEMSDCIVVGYSPTDAVYINPSFWAERFSGDFDGDIIGILPCSGLIDESKIRNAVSSKSKGKSEMTIAESVARSFYAKLLIPYADMMLTISAEQGLPLHKGREVLQGIIDSIKHFTAVPSHEALREMMGLSREDKASPVSQLMRGRLGAIKKEAAIRYAAMVSRSRTESSGISWMRDCESEFKIIACQNRRYADLCYQQYNLPLLKNYVEALNAAHFTSLIDPKQNFESNPVLPGEIIGKYRSCMSKELLRIKREYPCVVRLVYEVVKLYEEWVACLSRDECETAYGHLHKARSIIQCDDRMGGVIMRYLFISIGFQSDPKITLKSMKIFSYLPVRVGSYHLSAYLKKIGYKRSFSILKEQ